MIEAVIAPFALVSLAIIFELRPRGEPLVPPELAPMLIPGTPESPRPASSREANLREQLDDSRYV